MSVALTTDILLKSVGKQVRNDRNETLGEIIEITRNPSGGHIEYAILRTWDLFDSNNRFFAIPVSSMLIKISEAGEIIILASKDELEKANGITPDQCPSPNFHVKPPIFELFDYDGPKTLEPLKKEELNE